MRLLVVEHQPDAPAGLVGTWAGRRGIAVTTSRLLWVEHQPAAPAGLVGTWAAGRGIAVTTLRPAAGQPLPRSLAPGDAVVVLGSEETAFDDSVPWLQDELSFVRQAVHSDVPVLGIC